MISRGNVCKAYFFFARFLILFHLTKTRVTPSTHLLMCLCLYLESLTSIIRTGLPTLVELRGLLNSVITFLSQMTLLRWLTFLFGSLPVILMVRLFWIYFLLLALVFVLRWFFLHWEILTVLLSQFSLTFHHIHNGMARSIAFFMIILVLIGTVFVIIWKVFHARISSNSVLLLVLVNSVRGFMFELMSISVINSITLSLTHLHAFQLFVLLPWFIEISFFVCTKRINLLNLK